MGWCWCCVVGLDCVLVLCVVVVVGCVCGGVLGEL